MKRTDVGWRIVRAVATMPYGGLVHVKVVQASALKNEPELRDIALYLEELSRVLEGVASRHEREMASGEEARELVLALRRLGKAMDREDRT